MVWPAKTRGEADETENLGQMKREARLRPEKSREASPSSGTSSRTTKRTVERRGEVRRSEAR